MGKADDLQELMTLKVIAETLNRSNDLPEMLQAVLGKLLAVTDLSTGWIFLVGEKPYYQFAADHQLPPALACDDKKPMHTGVCFCLNQYWAGNLQEPVNIIECRRLEDARIHNRGDRCGLRHHATIPLSAGNETFGLLNVASPHKNEFTEKELTLLQAVAFQIGTAVKRIRLAEKEKERSLIDERTRLSRDLHDSVNQKLFSLALMARGARESVHDKAQLLQSLDRIDELSHEVLLEMRSLIWQLRPAGLEEGVITALANYGKFLGLETETSLAGVLHLPREVEETLWRIGQEALNNVKKHADARKVHIGQVVSGGKLVLTISDDGKGFRLEQHLRGASFGIENMKARCESLGGAFRMESEPGRGTIVTVSFPIEKKEGRDGDGD
ncbi:MAG TPA: GAF domain-containing sensor histidine kinase [Bacillales bacterium]|nr:GAF domain-containing sensor histidine kinase [Bacillales bacterium]